MQMNPLFNTHDKLIQETLLDATNKRRLAITESLAGTGVHFLKHRALPLVYKILNREIENNFTCKLINELDRISHQRNPLTPEEIASELVTAAIDVLTRAELATCTKYSTEDLPQAVEKAISHMVNDRNYNIATDAHRNGRSLIM